MEKIHGNSTYIESYNHQAYIACSRGGFTNDNLAELFSVTTRTIDTWKQNYPDFLRAIKKGKDEYDTHEVENALLKRAKGFEFKEVHTVLDENGKAIKENTKVIQKQALPDTGACAFWLKNRNRKRWLADSQIDRPAIFIETLEFIVKALHQIEPEGVRIISKHFTALVSMFKSELKGENEKSS